MKSTKYIGIALLFIFLMFPSWVLSKDIPVVRDNAGRKIHVEHPYKRIISLYGAHTVNLISLGLRDEIVGISRADRRIPWVKGKRVFSYHDGVERFLSVKPDLVLIRPMIDRGYGRLIRALESSGVMVASFQPRSIDEMFRYWIALGVLTGRKKQAQSMVIRFKDGLKAVLNQSSRIPGKKRKRVFFESIHSKMKTFSPESIAMFCLESAGGINIAKDAITVRNTNIAEYGKERILARASQIDVYLAQLGPMNHVTIDMILNEPGFQIIKAIKDRKVYLIEEEIVSRPTMNLIKGMKRISEYLYPEIFKIKR